MSSGTWAFIDEYGDPNLGIEVQGRSQFFIVAGVILDDAALASVRGALEVVRKDHFQAGPMKSKNLGADRGRWLRVLTSLADVPFGFYALVVDKRTIDASSGLQWKQSFYKNVCGRAYSKLMHAFPSLHVRADRYGDEKFKQSFGEYMKANHRPTLFDEGTFEFVDDRSDVAVQLADILCGLLARCYDPAKLLSAPEELLGVIAKRALLIDEWPPRYGISAGNAELTSASGPDARIAGYALRRAEEFTVRNEASRDDIVLCQVAVLERLVFERRIGEGKHVPGGALIDNLRDRGLKPKDGPWLRMSIIAKLRDHGVLVTSSPAGYKLPTSPKDVAEFLRHAENVCVPMLNRAAAAVDAVKLVTQGEVDVLADPTLASVKRLIEAAGVPESGPVDDAARGTS
jgi:hypothetical protein